MKSNNYNKTKNACSLAYVSQAIVVSFAPLLFVHFRNTYNISIGEIALIPVLFFAIQLMIDLFCSIFADRLGYRKCILAAEACTSLGLIGLAFLPEMISSPFAGILICTVVYAVESGLTEVLCNPIIEACPFSNKDSIITFLTAVYSFGCAGTVLISTLFLYFIGIENWRWLSIAFAVIPAVNILNFAVCPIESVVSSDKKIPERKLLTNPMFICFFIMMICAGATELGMSQWVSAYAEVALKVTKEIGDIAGPCAFALAEGVGRTLQSKLGARFRLCNTMLMSSEICFFCYIGVCMIPIPSICLFCCILCGFFVGALWPGTINAAAGFFPAGGTAMFSLLAMAGDVGCSTGPGLVGKCAAIFGSNLRIGMGIGCVFPIIFIIVTLIYKNKAYKAEQE